MVRDTRLGRRVPRASSDTHNDQPRTLLRMLAEVLCPQSEDNRVADRFEEEEAVEGDDA